MSVLIKGMEMPTSCLECRLYNDPWCMAKNRNQWRTAYNRPPKGERQNDCPLVPVPPHGRLIDADAALRDGWTISRTYSASPTEMVYETKAIDCLPTIIPAEENNNDR